MLTREQILKPRKLVTKTVPAPELGDGETLLVRRLSAREFMDLTAKAKTQPDIAYAHWIVATVVDEAGNRLFTEEDATTLGEQEITLVERLTDEAMKINGVGKEKAEGKSPTRSGDSSSA